MRGPSANAPEHPRAAEPPSSPENLCGGCFFDASPSSLFESMFGNQGTSGVGSTSSTSELDSAVSDIVDQILVNLPQRPGDSVTITISSGPIAGAEIEASRAVDGQLVVKIAAEPGEQLQNARDMMSDLRTALERTGEQNVRVDVNEANVSESDNTDSRSRGLENESYY